MWQDSVTPKSHTKVGFYYCFTYYIFKHESIYIAFPIRSTKRMGTICYSSKNSIYLLTSHLSCRRCSCQSLLLSSPGGTLHMQWRASESSPYRMRPDSLPLALISHEGLGGKLFFYKFGNFLMSNAALAFQDWKTSSTFKIGIINV